MKLIIYAHPDIDSHAKLTLQLLKEKLTAQKEEFEVIDLYAIGYHPVLMPEEMKEPSKQTKEFQQKILKADHLIFIYPIWWSAPPAILKGFMDKTFTAGFAFKYEHSIPKPLLKGKKATLFITTGSPKLLVLLFMGTRFYRVFARDTLGFCGIKTKVVHTGSARRLSEQQKKKIAKAVASF